MSAVARSVPARALARPSRPSRSSAAAHPRLRRTARLALVAAVLTSLGTGLAAPSALVPQAAAATATTTTTTTVPAPGSPEEHILTRVNQVRAQNGLTPLQYRARLVEVAETWSQEMARTKTLAHNPRVSSLIEPGWTAWGENVGFAGGYANNAERIFTGWMSSPGHRANILSTRFTSIGIGAALDSRGYLWATQDFATYR